MSLPTTKTEKVTYQDYFKINNDKRYEVITGDLIMVPAPNTEHQSISRKIEIKLCNLVYSGKLGEVYDAPIDVILDDNNVVQPDIIYIAQENKNIIKEKGIYGPPDLVIEIISPSSKYRDTYIKKDLYESFKIKEYWLVDPKNKNIEIFVLNEKEKYELFSEGFLEEEDKQIVKSRVIETFEIKMDEVFN